MKHLTRIISAFLIFFSILTVLSGCPGSEPQKKQEAKPVVRIGYMPLADHLALLVAYESSKGEFRNFKMELNKFTSWVDMEAALKNGTIDGAMFLSPLGMKLMKEGVPVKCFALGSENGSALVMGKWCGIENAEELKGRVSVIAVPNIYSIHNINLYRFLSQNGVKYGDEVKVVGISPTDMLASTMRKETQGFIAGEPFCGVAEHKKIGKIIAYSKDIWPSHPGGIFLINEKFLKENKKVVQELADALVLAGEFIEDHPREASRMCGPYYGIEPKLIEDVLTSPFDRISFGDLIPKKNFFDRINYYLIKMNLLSGEVPFSDFVDDTFIKRAYEKLKR